MPHRSLLKKLEAGECRIAFHGSAQPIRAFTSACMGLGADLNASLGLFTTEILESAAQYAQSAVENGEGGHEHVYVLAIPCSKPFNETSRDKFYGMDEDGNQLATPEDFVKLRKNLLSEGFDVLDFEGDEDVIGVCFEPEKAIILADLTFDQAVKLQEDGLCLFDGVSIFNMLMKNHQKELSLFIQMRPPINSDGPSP